MSARVPYVITGSSCRKSSANIKVTPPITAFELRRSWSVRVTASIWALWVIVHSSNIINDTSLPSSPFLRMAHTDFCCKEIVNGNLKVECADFLSFNRIAAIPEEAMASAIFPDCLTFANIKFARNVFAVPHGAKKPLLPLLKGTSHCHIFYHKRSFDL